VAVAVTGKEQAGGNPLSEIRSQAARRARPRSDREAGVELAKSISGLFPRDVTSRIATEAVSDRHAYCIASVADSGGEAEARTGIGGN